MDWTLWYGRFEQGTVELPVPPFGRARFTIDLVAFAMWIAGVSWKSAKVRLQRMKVA